MTAGGRPFDLIETMRFDPVEGIVALERHLARIAASAGALGFAFDRHAARNELHAATFRLREVKRVRMLLSRTGAIATEIRPLAPAPEEAVAVKISALPVDPADFRLRHKTTDRAFQDDARRAAGCFETLFVRPDGLLTEGSFTNLFVMRDGKLVTPPRTLGLLPGILRATLIERGEAIEGPLTKADLRGGFFIGNALRGLIAARLA